MDHLRELKRKCMPPGRRLTLRVTLQRLQIPIRSTINSAAVTGEHLGGQTTLTPRGVTTRGKRELEEKKRKMDDETGKMDRAKRPRKDVQHGEGNNKKGNIMNKPPGRRLTLRVALQRLQLPINYTIQDAAITGEHLLGGQTILISSGIKSHGKKKLEEKKRRMDDETGKMKRAKRPRQDVQHLEDNKKKGNIMNTPPGRGLTLRVALQHLQLPINHTIKDAAITGEHLSTGGSSAQPVDPVPGISLEQLSFHCVLGKGSYGKVMLASDVISKKRLAVKIIKKRVLLADDRDSTLIERRVLEVAAGSMFLTQAFATFQNQDYLFFVLEYLSGGDLDEFLKKNGRLDLPSTKFFASEMVCGLQYLHAKGIIHRDLKPDNILLTSEGHMKIADFGLALENMFGASTATEYAGTLGYIAPEMLQGRRYNAAVDWWAVGVILYKMATGVFPFYCGDNSTTHIKSVLQDTPNYPEYLSPETQDIIKKLLCKTPFRRLGAIRSIRSHQFFQPIDWEELMAGRVLPPFSLKTPSPDNDPSRIKQEKITSSSEAKKIPIGSEDQKLFQGFSFISPNWKIFTQSTASPLKAQHNICSPPVKEAETHIKTCEGSRVCKRR